ncbi:hypothetical protein AVEN_4138-1 [Araneus ventricosus]|uniref:Uncharacterized protein n=1 Tax=Araneus ventricosus TaxID=182803 RepID=A0A4Y2TWZ3_ARAVE|nr:hypothetical protein AVEN_4138-1 [Araneus ventricosus]
MVPSRDRDRDLSACKAECDNHSTRNPEQTGNHIPKIVFDFTVPLKNGRVSCESSRKIRKWLQIYKFEPSIHGVMVRQGSNRRPFACKANVITITSEHSLEGSQSISMSLFDFNCNLKLRVSW